MPKYEAKATKIVTVIMDISRRQDDVQMDFTDAFKAELCQAHQF